MLNPETRSLLTDALSPPDGFRVDVVVATTYSLDLTALLLAPLSFSLQEYRTDEVDRVDPIALLDAIRRHAEHTTVFCQAGAIHQLANYRSLLAFAEGSVVQVRGPRPDRVFHPKIWLARFVDTAGGTRHRFLCLSRNLTFDRSWDTVLRLDETDDGSSDRCPDTRPLADFVRHLPELATEELSPARTAQVLGLADSVTGARFAVPDEFDELAFLPLGLDDHPAWPFPDRADRALVISAFLDVSTSRRLVRMSPDAIVLSRPESFDRVGARPFPGPSATFVLQRGAEVGVGDDVGPAVRTVTDTGQVPDGLHAKTFLLERGERAEVITGSANATAAAFGGNVEFDIVLRGPVATCGIDSVWTGTPDSPGFSRLVSPYLIANADGMEEPDADADWRIELFHARLAAVPPELHVTVDDDDRAAMRLAVEVPDDPGRTTVWPVSLNRDLHAVDLAEGHTWGPMALTSVTPFLSVRTTVGHVTRAAVVKGRLVGDVPERRHDALRDVLRTRDDVLRYLVFLLGDPAYVDMWGDGAGLAAGDWVESGPRTADLTLFEPLVRAVARGDESLARIAGVIADLRAAQDGNDLIPEGFQAIWDAVWECYQGERR